MSESIEAYSFQEIVLRSSDQTPQTVSNLSDIQLGMPRC